MTGTELKMIRRALGLTAVQLGKLLGYTGSDEVIAIQMSRFERGKRKISPQLAAAIDAYQRHGVPPHKLALLKGGVI